jgi:hypothetical protein
MALSNWDTMAFGPDGKSCNGVLKAIDGKGYIEIYKNWIYVHHPDMWVPGGPYVKDTIAEIRSGDLTLGRFHISAARGRQQQAVFVFAYTWKYEPVDVRFMAGIGCYGWGDEIPKYARAMKVDVSKYTDVYTGSGMDEKGIRYHSLTGIKKDGSLEDFRLDKKDGDNLEAEFIGVDYFTKEEFMEWLEKEIENSYIFDKEAKEWLEKVKIESENALRFNQGDQYFAKRLGFDTPATPVGKQEETILTGVLKEMARKDKDSDT